MSGKTKRTTAACGHEERTSYLSAQRQPLIESVEDFFINMGGNVTVYATEPEEHVCRACAEAPFKQVSAIAHLRLLVKR